MRGPHPMVLLNPGGSSNAGSCRRVVSRNIESLVGVRTGCHYNKNSGSLPFLKPQAKLHRDYVADWSLDDALGHHSGWNGNRMSTEYNPPQQ